MNGIRTSWVFACIGLMPGVAGAQRLADDFRVSSAIEVLEAWIDAQLAYESFPGISMGVVHDQELVWSKGFGFAHPDRNVPASPRTMYSICSISKLFTSIGVMQLRDLGKVRLDDPVTQHLPWFTIQQTHEDAAPITIEGLLTHSAGLPRESDFPYWTGPDFPFPTRDAIVARVSQQEMLYRPSTYFQYSNLGLTLAGEVVSTVSGMPFGSYIKRNILDPLGMRDTYTEHPDQHRGGQFATGYTGIRRHGKREKVGTYSVRGIAPAAGFVSTVHDLGRFASWQFRLLERGGQEVLHANTLREMHRVHWIDPDWETTWGLGFSVSRQDNKTFVGHGGYCPGYQTQLLMQPQEKIATIFMVNAVGVNTGLYARQTYEIVAPAIQDALKSPGKGHRLDPTLTAYTGRYESHLAGEAQVFARDSSLVVLYLPTENPKDGLTRLRRTGEHTFRRIRDDDSLGEEFRFEVGQDGKAVAMWRHSNYMRRATWQMNVRTMNER